MDTSRSSSASSQHYSVLLQTVSELRTDLEKTVTKIKSLEDQNQTLSSNYQVVKDELIQTRFKYNETKENYLNSVAEKFEAERQHEAFMDRLKVQLIEKTKEFEVIRDKLIPHDIDQLRIKVQEELEIQHKGQLQALEYQLEQDRAMFFAAKREYERLKVENETVIQLQHQKNQYLQAEHEEVENELRQRIVKLREAELAPVRDEKSRAQKTQATELAHLVEMLREEIKAVKSDRDEALFDLEQSKSSHEEAVTHLKSRLAVAEAERTGAEEQKSHFSLESERKEGLLRTARLSVEDLTARLELALKQVGEADRVLAAARDDHAKHLDAVQSSAESERADLQERVDSLTEKLLEKEDALRRALREAAESTCRSDTVIADMRRVHQLELQETRRKYVTVSEELQERGVLNFIYVSSLAFLFLLLQIEVEVSELKSTLKRVETESAQRDDQAKIEIEALRGELTKSKRDKDVNAARVRDLDQSAEASRRRLAQVQLDSTSKIQSLEASLRDAQSKASSLDAKLSALRESHQDLQGALKAAKDANVRLEQRNAEQNAQIDAIKKDFVRQLEGIAPSYKEQTEKFTKKMTLALNKEKKRADAYKSKALEAHAKVKTLSETLNREGPDDF